MPAHPDLKPDDARQIVSWIQSLTGTGAVSKSLPATGSVKATLDKKPQDRGVLLLSATYTDNGSGNSKPMTGVGSLLLMSPKLDLGKASDLVGYSSMAYNGMNLLIAPKTPGSFGLDSLDLTGVTGVTLVLGWQEPSKAGYDFELRLDSPDGTKLGEVTLKGSQAASKPGAIGGTLLTIPVTPVTDGKLHRIYLLSKARDPKELSAVAIQTLELTSK